MTFAASGGYSEEELEEKQQELRNTLDEQFGQNMMVIKDSMSQQYEEVQNSLRKELETAKQQVPWAVLYFYWLCWTLCLCCGLGFRLSFVLPAT